MASVPDRATGEAVALDGDWRGTLQLKYVVLIKGKEDEISLDLAIQLRLDAGAISSMLTIANERVPLRGRMVADRIELVGEIADKGAECHFELSGTFVDSSTLSGDGRMSMVDPNCMVGVLWDESDVKKHCPIVWINGTWRASR